MVKHAKLTTNIKNRDKRYYDRKLKLLQAQIDLLKGA